MEEFPNAYFGFTGLLTFPDTERLREAVSIIPLDRLLLVISTTLQTTCKAF